MAQIIDHTALPVLLTVPESVRVSGLSRSELYVRMRDGRLAFVKVGRARRVVTGSLLTMLDRLARKIAA